MPTKETHHGYTGTLATYLLNLFFLSPQALAQFNQKPPSRKPTDKGKNKKTLQIFKDAYMKKHDLKNLNNDNFFKFMDKKIKEFDEQLTNLKKRNNQTSLPKRTNDRHVSKRISDRHVSKRSSDQQLVTMSVCEYLGIAFRVKGERETEANKNIPELYDLCRAMYGFWNRTSSIKEEKRPLKRRRGEEDNIASNKRHNTRVSRKSAKETGTSSTHSCAFAKSASEIPAGSSKQTSCEV